MAYEYINVEKDEESIALTFSCQDKTGLDPGKL